MSIKVNEKNRDRIETLIKAAQLRGNSSLHIL